MSPQIHQILPDAQALLDLSAEELAGYLMEYLNALPEKEQNNLSRHNFSNESSFREYPLECRKDIARAFMEAWMWLEREGLLAPRPASTNEWQFITRRGKQLKEAIDVQAFQKANLLPKSLLHPIIAQKVWTQFIRGEYDTAVFQAFKNVEIAVRQAGQFSETDLGVTLMRNAFHPTNGPLTDKSLPEPERIALRELFSGAIGSYKNPHSHRHVKIEALEAVEMIMLASHLLHIVDSRTSAS